GESLDHAVTLSRVVELAVPHFADWCAVDIVEDGQSVPRRLAVAHVDPRKVELVRGLQTRLPRHPDAPRGVPQVLRSGRSELYSEINDAVLKEASVDGERLRVAHELKLHSAMIVPLATRGRVLGAMTFVAAESGQTYTEKDLRFAEEL